MNIESNFKIEEIKCNRCNYPNKVAFQQYNFMAKDDECVNKLKEENETLKYRLEFMNNQANSVNSTFHKALDDARTLKEENEKLKAEIFKSESNEVAYKTYIEKLKAENEDLALALKSGMKDWADGLKSDMEHQYSEEINQLKAQLQPKKKVYKCNTCYDTKISVTYQFISDEYVLSRCPDCYKKEAKPESKSYKCGYCKDIKKIMLIWHHHNNFEQLEDCPACCKNQ
jgi:hypothetical protein